MSTDVTDRSRRLVLSLHRATALVDQVADVYLRPAHGIGVSDFAALSCIGAVGPARQAEVARALGVSRAAVTQRLAQLLGRGLVEVAADPHDRRAHLVTLSRDGRRLLEEAWDGLARSDDGVERGVDLVALQQALDSLIGNAERHLAGRAGR